MMPTALFYAQAPTGGNTLVSSVGEVHLPFLHQVSIEDSVTASISGMLQARLDASLSSELEAAELEVRL